MYNITRFIKRTIILSLVAISNVSIAQTVITSDNFHSGWGNWVDGDGNGNDCRRVNNTPLNLGRAVEIQNGNTGSYTRSKNLNLTAYSLINIEFKFRTANFSNNERFYLEFSNNGGSSWTIVKTYRRGNGNNNNNTFYFSNNTNYTNTQTLTDDTYNFGNNSRFRIRSAANNNNDKLYLDDIIISGVEASSEIDVRGNNISIPDGDTTPSIGDNTDFGSVNVGTVVTKQFSIHNLGSGILTITNPITLSNSTDFAVILSPSPTIGTGSSTNFRIRFKPLTVGPKSTTVTIVNNDPDENPYTFVINAISKQNFFDSDGDGIYDNVDIDDDNDGIPDHIEESNCKRSPTSTSVNYKFLNETFGTGTGRATINTNNYGATTTYCFEDGIVGPNTPECPFQSSWILDDGEYTVVSKITGNSANDPENIHGDLAWYNGPDHTPGDVNGRMAVFNASFNPGVFYETNISGVLPNIPITYSFWALNIMSKAYYPGTILPDITIQFLDHSDNILETINTGPFGRCSTDPNDNSCDQGQWLQFTTSINLGDISDFKVRFINNSSGGNGNDLAIDDIIIAQTLCDTDGDGVADVFDLDSDNDGIPDVVEAGLGHLSGGRATLTNASGWQDTNGNGMHDLTEGHVPLDSDNDGVPNYLDLDSDNDSIFDVDESGAGNTADANFQNGDGDIDGDGVGDGPDSDAVRQKDFDSNNVIEYFADGILDVYDFFNGNTMATAYGNSNQGIGNTYFVKDTDGDGIPDYIDTTSDGVTFDISHTLYAHLDANNDGVIDGTSDADWDGIPDLFDTDNTRFGSPRDLNQKLQLYFDGRNDYAQDTSVISNWQQATIMAWILVDASAGSEMRVLGQDQFYIDITLNKIVAHAKGTTITGPRISKGQWMHVAAVYNGDQNSLKLFLNGDEVANNNQVSGSLPADGSLFTIGKSSSANNRYFKGYFDEVRIFSKALTNDELRKMIYQEIFNNNGIIRGEVIPRDITDNTNSNNIITPLGWNHLVRYFRMDTYKGDIIDNLTTATIDVGSGARIYNTKIIKPQTAPLPFETKQNGSLPVAVDDFANGINGQDVVDIDWSIVRIKHNDVSYDDHQKHLGLFVNEMDSNSNPIKFTVDNDSELKVSWYLKLDGFIDLVGESQLVQTDDSMLDVSSKGKLERDQQGTADRFTYNYWSSPVSPQSTTSNNNNYRVPDVLRDGENHINFLTSGYNGTNTSPIGIADYWIWKFANLPSDEYSAWQHIRSTGTLRAGEGYTMKGPGTGGVQDEQNYVFIGKPNNGDITLTLNANNDYLVGNPYPSAIDGYQFIIDNGPIIAGNGSTTGTLYFWEHWGGGSHILAEYQGGYATYNLSGGTPSASFGTNDPDVGTGGTPTKIPGRYIPVGQAFFVVAEGEGGTIKFNNGQRIFMKEGNNSVFVRNTENSPSINYNPDGEDLRVKFRIGFNSVNTIHRQILLTIDEMATEGIDWGYDAKYIDDQMDDMYWMIEGEKFNIQGRNEVTASSVVPLGLHLRDGGQNRISIDFLENVPDDTQIFIHDKVLDLYHDLRQSDYVFNLPAGEYLNRFEITFNNGESLNVDSTETNPLTVYFNNEQGNLVLLNPMLLKVNSIEIFNLLGQSLYNIKLSEPKRYSEYLLNNISTGTYIVKLNTGTGILSDKVLVK